MCSKSGACSFVVHRGGGFKSWGAYSLSFWWHLRAAKTKAFNHITEFRRLRLPAVLFRMGCQCKVLMRATKRPKHLKLWQIKFPVTAVISILHRASGVCLFLLIPYLLWLLSCSLASAQSFGLIQTGSSSCVLKVGLQLVLSAVIFHTLAGIRHLCMDIGIGESLCGGRLSAYLVFILSILGMISLGVWLW